jgi:hypothetical protein
MDGSSFEKRRKCYAEGTLHSPESIFAATPGAFSALRPTSSFPLTHINLPFRSTFFHACAKRFDTVAPISFLLAIVWTTPDKFIIVLHRYGRRRRKPAHFNATVSTTISCRSFVSTLDIRRPTLAKWCIPI